MLLVPIATSHHPKLSHFQPRFQISEALCRGMLMGKYASYYCTTTGTTTVYGNSFSKSGSCGSRWVLLGPLLSILCSLSLSLSLAIGLPLPLLWLNHVSRAACGVCARFVCENGQGRVAGYLVQCASQVVKHTLPETSGERRTQLGNPFK
jgi:hypothetical protein